MHSHDPTRRFSSRVDHYARYRPGYPTVLVDFLQDACDLTPDHVVADIGCGTGALADLFLKNGNIVYGIEPNPAMRAAAERALRGNDRFRSVDARGESTTLPDGSVDFVMAGRTFHWLETETALAEFTRILKREGWAVIVSFRRRTSSAFLAEYEHLLLSFGIHRRAMAQRRLDLDSFLAARSFEIKTLEQERIIGLEDLKGLTLSYSSSPEPDDPNIGPMLDAIDALFQKHQHGDRVSVRHDIMIYYKQLCLPGTR